MSSSPIIYPTSSSSTTVNGVVGMESDPSLSENYLASSMDIPSSIGSTSAYRGGQTPPRTGTTENYFPTSDLGNDHVHSYSQNRREDLSEIL